MLRAQQGDQRAYDDLLRLLAEKARGFVGRRVGWADWTEDVVQDALLTVHRARRTYDAARPFAPWFYAILNSRLIDTLRARKRVTLREFPDEDILAAQPAPAAADSRSSDVREVLARAVAALPRVQREVVSLMKYRGFVRARGCHTSRNDGSRRQGNRASRLQGAARERRRSAR